MQVIRTESLLSFEAWAGAVDTKNFLIDHLDDEEFEAAIEEMYPNGLEEVMLNDILWFDTDWIASLFGFETWEEYEKDRKENMV